MVAGLKGDTTTEIVSGLKAGQQVVTSTGVDAFSSARLEHEHRLGDARGGGLRRVRAAAAPGGFPGGGALPGG